MSTKKSRKKIKANATKPTDVFVRLGWEDDSIAAGLERATWSSPPVTLAEMADLGARLRRLHEDAERLLERAEDNLQPGPIGLISSAFDNGDFGNSFGGEGCEVDGTEYGADVVTRSQALRALAEALEDEEEQGAA